MPAIGSSDIAFTTQLEQLVARIQATKPASEALIHDLDQFIQKNLVVNQTPTEKPNPTAQDKSAVRVATAVLSMVGRCCEADKDEALVDLIQGYWPVIWRWLQFLERVFSQLDYGVEVKFKSICVIATTFECLTVQDALKTHIRATPEAVSLIVGHWKRQGRDHKVDSLFNAFSMPKPFTPVLSSLLGNCPPEIGICDMVADTCGGPKSFAVIAMEHWAAALQDHGDHSFANLKAHLILIHNLMFPHPRQLIHYALLNQGMVPALVKSLVWLAGFSDTDSKAGYCVWRCCHLLQTAFVVPNEECWVSQALDAGLVSAYLRSSSLMMALPDYVRDECTLLFSRILCRSLIYLQVLKAAEKAIRRVDRLHLDHYSRQAAPVWASWTAFREITMERMALKRAVDELDEQMPQAKQCRRVLCDGPDKEDRFMRCSGCLSATYCSRICQKMDWPAHKAACQTQQKLLRDGELVPLSASSRAFIHELATFDMQKNFSNLISTFWEKFAGYCPSELAISVDYVEVPVQVTLIKTTDFDNNDALHWREHNEAIVRSGGTHMAVKATIQRGQSKGNVLWDVKVPEEMRTRSLVYNV